jgi:putative ABC transport system substrate-binding protein
MSIGIGFAERERHLVHSGAGGGSDPVIDRRAFVAGSISLLAAPLAAQAQTAQKVHRIGILSPSPAYSGRIEAIRQGLRVLGYVEGRNLAIERRDARAEAELPALAAELVRLGVDLIVTGGSASIRPTMEATTTILKGAQTRVHAAAW